MTLNLLDNQEKIRNQIAARFKYIMVDEFQDTNQLQWDIISHLDNGKNIFIVGDPKQSIYGFRAADVRVFDQVKQEFLRNNSNSDHLLYESFRFKKAVSNFVNDVFTGVLKPSSSNPWEVSYDAIETSRADSEGGQVELALLEKDDSVDIQADFIATRILEILEKSKYKASDIGIILRTRTHLNTLEKQMRDYSIPFRTVGGIGFYQGQEIYDVYHLLKFLIDPQDDFALVAILRSPFVNISDKTLFQLSLKDYNLSYWDAIKDKFSYEEISADDQEKLLRFVDNAFFWLNRRDRTNLYELLSEIFSDNLYRSIVATDIRGDQILANIDKILNYSLEYEKKQSGSIIDFTESLKYLINRHQKEGEAILDLTEDNSVKILTIHQAKGLEFPVVFLPYLEQTIATNDRQPVFFDETTGVIAKPRNFHFESMNSISDTCFLYEWIKYKSRQKDLAELKRLFYVGCTRARDGLVLSAQIKNDKVPAETPLNWLLEEMGRESETLENGLLRLNEFLEIFIYRSFETKTSLRDHIQKNIIQSLDQLVSNDSKSADEYTDHPVLSLTEDQPKGEIFSATQLLVFRENKREYQQRYHLGYFEDDYEKIGVGESAEENALLRGKLVHRMMELYPDYNFDELLADLDLANKELIAVLKSDLLAYEKRIRDSEQIQKILQAKKFQNEISILRRLGDDFLTGTIDRLYLDNQENWVIVDYKSNRIRKDQVEKIAMNYKVQMEVYALLLQSIYPQQKNYQVGLYFINADEMYSKVYSRDQIKMHEKEFLNLIKEIKQYYPYTSKVIE
jgi:ATP-dependent helicase/nuclease subunit A